MKILTWNVNGIRTIYKSPFKDYLDCFGADLICFQETKLSRDSLEETTGKVDGYDGFFGFSTRRLGYGGVASYVKDDFMPAAAEEGITGALSRGVSDEVFSENTSSSETRHFDLEGRVVITQHPVVDKSGKEFVLDVVNVYAPHAEPDKPERAIFKAGFNEILAEKVKALAKKEEHIVVLLGDINISHRPIDHRDGESDGLSETEFMSSPFRQWLGGLLSPDENNIQFYDAFRVFHPDRKFAFTCWCTKLGARENNYGTRIDYILISNKDFLVDCDISPDVQGSDHCPVWAKLSLSPCPNRKPVKPPSLCSRYFPEFSGGKQASLLNFAVKGKMLSAKTPQLPPVVAKKDGGAIRKKPVAKKGGNVAASNLLMSSFFKKEVVSEVKVEHTMANLSDSSQESTTEMETVTQEATVLETDMKSVKTSNGLAANSQWKQIFKPKPPPPMCRVHQLPCAERVVRKKGPNLNRRFWCCPQGEGRAGDPNARCNFFLWAK